jgi:hypothetical protein
MLSWKYTMVTMMSLLLRNIESGEEGRSSEEKYQRTGMVRPDKGKTSSLICAITALLFCLNDAYRPIT